MEGKYMKKHFLVFLLVLLVVIIEPTEAATLDKWQIHMINGLSNGQVLLAHCKSKDDDLGERNISTGFEFNWTFRVNIFDTTLFWCYLRKPNGQSKSFEVFWVEKKSVWLYYRCLDANCFWTARDDGIYLRNNPDSKEILVHKWD